MTRYFLQMPYSAVGNAEKESPCGCRHGALRERPLKVWHLSKLKLELQSVDMTRQRVGCFTWAQRSLGAGYLCPSAVHMGPEILALPIRLTVVLRFVPSEHLCWPSCQVANGCGHACERARGPSGLPTGDIEPQDKLLSDRDRCRGVSGTVTFSKRGDSHFRVFFPLIRRRG